MKIQRIFHPVGQGAFYTECITNTSSKFNIVYDCGTKTAKEAVDLNKVVNTQFALKDEILWLFISHFDKDHVSGIDYLAGRCTIKNVVIPYMDKASRNLYLIDYLMSLDGLGTGADTQMVELIEDPNGYFRGKGVKVYQVLSEDEDVPTGFSEKSSEKTVKDGERSETPIWEWMGEVFTNSDTSETIIRGGSFQAKIGTCFWQLKPFNYKYHDLRKSVLDEFRKIKWCIIIIDIFRHIACLFA